MFLRVTDRIDRVRDGEAMANMLYSSFGFRKWRRFPQKNIFHPQKTPIVVPELGVCDSSEGEELVL